MLIVTAVEVDVELHINITQYAVFLVLMELEVKCNFDVECSLKWT